MSKKIRLEVKVDFKNKKSVMDALKKTEAYQISCSPIKSGGYFVKFSIKGILDKKSIDEVLSKMSLTAKESNG